MLDFKKLFLSSGVNFTDITHLPVPDTVALTDKGLLVRKLDLLLAGPGLGAGRVGAGLVWLFIFHCLFFFFFKF